MSELGIKGVYQLQGGIDKYFKKFPSGGQFYLHYCAVRMIYCLSNTIFVAAAFFLSIYYLRILEWKKLRIRQKVRSLSSNDRSKQQ